MEKKEFKTLNKDLMVMGSRIEAESPVRVCALAFVPDLQRIAGTTAN